MGDTGPVSMGSRAVVVLIVLAMALVGLVPGTAAGASQTVFRDDFERSSVGEGWQVPAGWSISEGKLVSTASGTTTAMLTSAVPDELVGAGYYVEARVAKSGAHGVGLVAGRTARDSGTYLFPHLYQDTEARLGREVSRYVAIGSSPFAHSYGEFHTVRSEVRGTQVRMLVDGVEVVSGAAGYEPGAWAGLRATNAGGTTFSIDWFEFGPLDADPTAPTEPTEPTEPTDPTDPTDPATSFAPGPRLAVDRFDLPNGSPLAPSWDLRWRGNGVTSVEDGWATLEASDKYVVDLYAARNDVQRDDAYQRMLVRWSGRPRGGAALLFRYDDTTATPTRPDGYRLFWLPGSDDGLWIRHTKDGVKTTLARTDVWDGQPPGTYILEGGISGNHLRVRVRPAGSPERAPDDWDLEYVDTGAGYLPTGGVGMFAFLQQEQGARIQLDDWELFEVAD